MHISTSRRLLLGAAAVLAALPATAAFAAETVTVKTLNAKNQVVDITVPKNPKRIAIADYAVLDTLDHWKLTDRIVALTQTTALPYLPQYFKKSNKIKNIGTLKEIDFEGLMESEPDVIFISGRLQKKYDQLSKIAPVVYMTTDRAKGSLQSFNDNLMNLAKIFGLENQAKADLAGFAARAVNIKSASAGKTALVGLATSSHVNLLGNAARCSLIGHEFGFTNVASKANANHGNEASFELILKHNPDYFFVLDRDSAIARPGAKLAKDILNNELVNKTSAAQNNRIVYLTPAAWYLAEGGVSAMNIMFSEVEKALGISQK